MRSIHSVGTHQQSAGGPVRLRLDKQRENWETTWLGQREREREWMNESERCDVLINWAVSEHEEGDTKRKGGGEREGGRRDGGSGFPAKFFSLILRHKRERERDEQKQLLKHGLTDSHTCLRRHHHDVLVPIWMDFTLNSWAFIVLTCWTGRSCSRSAIFLPLCFSFHIWTWTIDFFLHFFTAQGNTARSDIISNDLIWTCRWSAGETTIASPPRRVNTGKCGSNVIDTTCSFKCSRCSSHVFLLCVSKNSKCWKLQLVSRRVHTHWFRSNNQYEVRQSDYTVKLAWRVFSSHTHTHTESVSSVF